MFFFPFMEGEGGGWILKRINIQKETEPPTPKNKQTKHKNKQTTRKQVCHKKINNTPTYS